jgi:hypothetical protein
MNGSFSNRKKDQENRKDDGFMRIVRKGTENKIRDISMVLAAAMVIGMVGCATSIPASAPGIQPTEQAVLVRDFYWQPKEMERTISDAQIHELFAKAGNDDLDGENAEGLTSALAFAIASTGDQHFSELLARESQETQRRVIREIRCLWEADSLSYPHTEEIERKLSPISTARAGPLSDAASLKPQ